MRWRQESRLVLIRFRREYAPRVEFFRDPGALSIFESLISVYPIRPASRPAEHEPRSDISDAAFVFEESEEIMIFVKRGVSDGRSYFEAVGPNRNIVPKLVRELASAVLEDDDFFCIHSIIVRFFLLKVQCGQSVVLLF